MGWEPNDRRSGMKGNGPPAVRGGRSLEDPEPRLIELAQRGDAAAYAELVRRYQDLAFRVAYLITGSAEDAEDAAQEGFLRAYRALPRFRLGAPLRPWLLRIVANAARNRRAAVRRHPTLALSMIEGSPATDPDPTPEATALADEARRELLAAIAALRDDDQRVIALRYFLDLSEGETAEVLGCARGTVKSRLSRALGRLRAQLGTTGPVGDLSAAGSEAGGGRHG